MRQRVLSDVNVQQAYLKAAARHLDSKLTYCGVPDTISVWWHAYDAKLITSEKD